MSLPSAFYPLVPPTPPAPYVPPAPPAPSGDPSLLVSGRIVRTNALEIVLAPAPNAFDAGGYTDALNARNYVVTRLPSGSGFAPQVARVVEVSVAADLSSAVYRLELETALEAATGYDVTASSNLRTRPGA